MTLIEETADPLINELKNFGKMNANILESIDEQP